MWDILKGIIIYESLFQVHEAIERSHIYKKADLYAKSTNKPLIVIGGPSGGNYLLKQVFGYRAHGCGDVCVDINPKGCIDCQLPVLADITNIPLPDKCGVAYVSHVLEHLPTINHAKAAMSELNRIADAIFICYPNKLSLMAWLHPDHHLWVSKNGNGVVFQKR